MTAQDVREWIRSVVRKAVAEKLGEQPIEVIILKPAMRSTTIVGVGTTPYRATARVKMEDGKVLKVSLDIVNDGSYHGFRVI